ncbi:SRPBCC family protein [Streptomyces sp. NPDC050211]|uniref:SRPBCC family protein n=1 Tax=Streptomyces sp. NPDC050211 TaxID=3154932 RepID=UPI003433888D
MSGVRETIVVDRSPEDVYAYLSDPSHLPEWQESAVAAEQVEEGPLGLGSHLKITRHIGRRDIPMTMEVTEYDPPRIWGLQGIDGPVRGHVHGEIDPIDEGRRSRVTLEVDVEGHGIGKVLVPLVVRPQVRKELPRNEQHLKDRLENPTP